MDSTVTNIKLVKTAQTKKRAHHGIGLPQCFRSLLSPEC